MSDAKITSLTAHTALIDTDVLPVVDITATATKKTTWANIKSVLKTYFDTLYPSGSGTSTGTNTGDNTVATALTGTPSITVATVTTTGTLELGHATDTTISRVSAGVIAVEGVTIATSSNTLTFTNKRFTPRVLSAASYTTDTGTSLNCDNLDEFIVTAQAGALKLNNPTGTPTDGQLLFVAVTGTAARALTYDTQFEASNVALPTTTVTTACLNMIFRWAAERSKWIILGAV